MRPRTGRNAIASRIGEKISQHPRGRVCESDACVTVLSVYNESVFCSVHQPWTRRTGSRN